MQSGRHGRCIHQLLVGLNSPPPLQLQLLLDAFARTDGQRQDQDQLPIKAYTLLLAALCFFVFGRPGEENPGTAILVGISEIGFLQEFI